jgi:hypothetical protein
VTAVAVASNSIAPGTLGFLVVFGMAAVLTVLFRSMSKHLRKVNQAARRDEEAAATGASASAADAPPSPGTGDAAPTGSGNQRLDS